MKTIYDVHVYDKKEIPIEIGTFNDPENQTLYY